ncbi:MAG: hypothetical protein KF862_02295 [Chitinophagaceae bacterium]|nr:hypothetical protein [Chitinophagaceae bacterium]
MNKLQVILVFSILTAGIHCKNAESSKEEDTAAKQFYPIAGYIESQLNYLDSVPLAIIHYTTVNNSTDTAIIEKNEFRKNIGQEFIRSDISGEDQKKSYAETSFIDATLGVITLSYAPQSNDHDLSVRKTDILLTQENAAVKTIYIEKIIKAGNSVVLKKMLWNANKSCQVTSLIQEPNQPDKIIQERFIWDE